MLMSCAAMKKFWKLAEPQFLHLYNGDNTTTYHKWLVCKPNVALLCTWPDALSGSIRRILFSLFLLDASYIFLVWF